ncbi:hypothetical protein AWR36_012570 [Microbulbifer flavimaris]|uniref:PEGA domain-containing protein n=1 Tax=Microbulbifer flavimaris TaxID=1781068 RepID=A0ABX4HXI2_9GAMM|nr:MULTISPECIES: hypothetical protein [Microbulbifer]KUJ82612.1 hypothetical protein AVO43_12535 [Microbulbifer sp. ZGT114]PCO04822.1 hypothetical protein AWR36_012570 [Microbulbifer flavimaris]
MQHRDQNPDDKGVIRPADFSFGGSETAESTAQPKNSTTKSKDSSRDFRPVLIGSVLAFGLVGVFWLLPQAVEKPKVQRPVASTEATQEPTTGAKPSPIKASPFSDAEIAQQRREVQKVLQEILALQEELRERQVDVWAAEDFGSARGIAEEADVIYRQRKFMQALEKYRASLAALQEIRESIPERIEKHLAEGNDALDRGDAEGAHHAFDLVLTISEDHPRGVKGKARAEKLPEAWQHFSRGKQAFAEQDLDTARDALRQSLAVDGEIRPAKVLLPQVLSAIKDRDYSEAMSAGYAAIGDGDFSAALEAFQSAQKLKPNEEDPALGIQQAKSGLTQTRIDRLFAQARQQETSEEWHAAVKSYDKLLAMDKSLVSAITGKARAQARAELDDRLQELLNDRLSLSGSQRNQYARTVLKDARAINAESPRLQGQIESLETALTQAVIPVPVKLQSDATTQVTIYHVGRLGNFNEREIPLKPGRYTAVGTRAGYRDVRREFTVVPGEEPPVVVIRCAEKINSANNS